MQRIAQGSRARDERSIKEPTHPPPPLDPYSCVKNGMFQVKNEPILDENLVNSIKQGTQQRGKRRNKERGPKYFWAG